MAQKKKKDEDIMTKVPEDRFKFLTPEEIDRKIIGEIDRTRAAKKDRYTEVGILLREQVIFDLIGQGLSYRRITEEIAARWGICHTLAEKFYYQALKKLKENTLEVQDSWKEILISRLEAVMEESSQSHDRASYLKACKQLADLTGANAPKEVTLTNTDLTFNFQ